MLLRLLFLLPLALVTVLSVCASQRLESFVGKSLLEAELQLGPPERAYDTDDGTRVFVWSQERSQTTPGYVKTQTRSGSSKNRSQKRHHSRQNNQKDIYTRTDVQPPVTTSIICNYAVYARKVRNDIEGPGAWQVVSYQKPVFECNRP